MVNIKRGAGNTKGDLYQLWLGVLKIKDSKKYVSYLILGEFNRTILDTIKKILNTFLRAENGINEFDSIDDFIQDVIKDMYFFSREEASRVIKLVPYLREEIELKIKKYQKFYIPLKYPIEKLLKIQT